MIYYKNKNAYIVYVPGKTGGTVTFQPEAYGTDSWFYQYVGVGQLSLMNDDLVNPNSGVSPYGTTGAAQTLAESHITSNMFTQPWVNDYVRQQLGAPTVVVELTDEHIRQATQNALRTCNQWMCESQMRVAWERAESVSIALEPGVRGVLEVQAMFPNTELAYTRTNIFEIMHRMVFPGFPLSDWYMFRSFYDMFQEVRGTEPDWRYDAASRILYVDCWGGPYNIFYVVAVDLTLDSFKTSQQSYQQHFLDLIMCECKKILANIRGKFSTTIPVPGGSLSTDAELLRQEAKEKEKEVTDWLQSIARFSRIAMVG